MARERDASDVITTESSVESSSESCAVSAQSESTAVETKSTDSSQVSLRIFQLVIKLDSVSGLMLRLLVVVVILCYIRLIKWQIAHVHKISTTLLMIINFTCQPLINI